MVLQYFGAAALDREGRGLKRAQLLGLSAALLIAVSVLAAGASAHEDHDESPLWYLSSIETSTFSIWLSDESIPVSELLEALPQAGAIMVWSGGGWFHHYRGGDDYDFYITPNAVIWIDESDGV